MSARPPLCLCADVEWLHAPPPLALVPELGLVQGALAGLVSPPGAGKTFVLLSLATAIALGAEWLGLPIAAAGPVVYAVGEGHALFPRRLAALRTAYGLHADEPSGVVFARAPLSLLAPDDVTALLDAVREALAGEPPRLVAFDPLASFMAGGDENSTADMSAVVAALNRIRADTGAAVLVAHHTGWNAERERGSTVLRGALDALYQLRADEGSLTLECVKLRDGLAPAPLLLRLQPVDDSCVVARGDASPAAPVALTAKQREVLAMLRTIVLDEPVSYSRWRDACGLPHATFERAAAVLVRGGWVLKLGKGRAARYAPPGPLPSTLTSPSRHPHEGEADHPHSPSHPFRGEGVRVRPSPALETAGLDPSPSQGCEGIRAPREPGEEPAP